MINNALTNPLNMYIASSWADFTDRYFSQWQDYLQKLENFAYLFWSQNFKWLPLAGWPKPDCQ